MSLTLLGTLDLQEAKRIRSQLETLGIKLEIAVKPETCATGCKPVAEVFVEEADIPRVQEFFGAEKKRAFEGLDIDVDQLGHVFNTEVETAVCPACGTSFKTTCTECPDCGLVFVTEGM